MLGAAGESRAAFDEEEMPHKKSTINVWRFYGFGQVL